MVETVSDSEFRCFSLVLFHSGELVSQKFRHSEIVPSDENKATLYTFKTFEREKNTHTNTPIQTREIVILTILKSKQN